MTRKLASGISVNSTGVSAVGHYTVINVQEDDLGIYQVVVSNAVPKSELLVSYTLKTAGDNVNVDT